jgi:hypothetical protein
LARRKNAAKLEAWREGLGIDEAAALGIVDGFLREIVSRKTR